MSGNSANCKTTRRSCLPHGQTSEHFRNEESQSLHNFHLWTVSQSKSAAVRARNFHFPKALSGSLVSRVETERPSRLHEVRSGELLSADNWNLCVVEIWISLLINFCIRCHIAQITRCPKVTVDFANLLHFFKELFYDKKLMVELNYSYPTKCWESHQFSVRMSTMHIGCSTATSQPTRTTVWRPHCLISQRVP